MQPPANAPHRRERPSLARDLLSVIARRGDLIAEAPDGRVFVLLEMDRPTFERLCVTDAEREDLEDEPDDDTQDEPSLAELHPMDRSAPTSCRNNLHNMKMETGH